MENILFHVHSKHSYDSFMEPGKIIEIAKKLGYKGVAIVDHENISGGLEAKRLETPDFKILVCGEYHSRFGDIVGVGLRENITVPDPFEIVREIKSQGGQAIWVHPCRTYLLPRGAGKKKPLPPKEFIESLDYIETYNAQTRPRQNMKAKKIAEKFKVKEIVGLDAHFYFEIKKLDQKRYSFWGYVGSFFAKIIKKFFFSS